MLQHHQQQLYTRHACTCNIVIRECAKSVKRWAQPTSFEIWCNDGQQWHDKKSLNIIVLSCILPTPIVTQLHAKSSCVWFVNCGKLTDLLKLSTAEIFPKGKFENRRHNSNPRSHQWTASSVHNLLLVTSDASQCMPDRSHQWTESSVHNLMLETRGMSSPKRKVWRADCTV